MKRISFKAYKKYINVLVSFFQYLLFKQHINIYYDTKFQDKFYIVVPKNTDIYNDK